MTVFEFIWWCGGITWLMVVIAARSDDWTTGLVGLYGLVILAFAIRLRPR